MALGQSTRVWKSENRGFRDLPQVLVSAGAAPWHREEPREKALLVLLLKTEQHQKAPRSTAAEPREHGPSRGKRSQRSSLGRARDDARGEVEQVAVDFAQVPHLVLQLGHTDPQLVLAAQDALLHRAAHHGV